jgi:hypothetical protein
MALTPQQKCSNIEGANPSLTTVSSIPVPPHKKSWSDTIGFDPRATLGGNTDLDKVFRMEVYARKNPASAANPLKQPTDPNNSEIVYPYGSALDFSELPIVFVPVANLIMWLGARGIKVRKEKKNDHAFLREMVHNIEAMPNPPSVCAQIEDDFIHWETLSADEPSTWTYDSVVIFAFVRDTVFGVNATSVATVFGDGRNGVRLRALRRFNGGHYDVATIAMRTAIIQATSAPVTLLQCECCPSMKSDRTYTVIIALSVSGEYINFPVSRCDCPNGTFFCSHMLGFLLILRVIQQQLDWTLADLASAMVAPVMVVSRMAIPFSLIYERSDKAMAEAEKKANAEIKAACMGGRKADDDEDEGDDDADEDAAMHEDARAKNKKSHDIRARVDEEMERAMQYAVQRGSSAKAETKHPIDHINEHNAKRVHRVQSHEDRQRQLLRHERVNNIAAAEGYSMIFKQYSRFHSEERRDQIGAAATTECEEEAKVMRDALTALGFNDDDGDSSSSGDDDSGVDEVK